MALLHEQKLLMGLSMLIAGSLVADMAYVEQADSAEATADYAGLWGQGYALRLHGSSTCSSFPQGCLLEHSQRRIQLSERCVTSPHGQWLG